MLSPCSVHIEYGILPPPYAIVSSLLISTELEPLDQIDTCESSELTLRCCPSLLTKLPQAGAEIESAAARHGKSRRPEMIYVWPNMHIIHFAPAAAVKSLIG